MKILALDFSSAQRSAAVLIDGNTAAGEAVDASPGREMKPFALIEAALRQAGLERETIEGIVVGIGPGSYAGIRVAIALAQGWQLATGVKLRGISSVAGLAAQVVEAGVSGRFSVVIDAQRGELYHAGFETHNRAARETSALKLATVAEVQASQRADETLVGPEVTRWFPGGRIMFPGAAALGRQAQWGGATGSGEPLEPIYLRETTFVKAPPSRPLPLAS